MINKIGSLVFSIFIILLSSGTKAEPDPQVLINYNNPKAQDRLKNTEIESLMSSIENDKKILKQIEEAGSGIEDYKTIKKNLKIRQKRLKELQKNRK